MRCSNFRVLATHVLLFLAADVTLAEDTTTTTQRSTTVLTLTTTVTSGQSVFPSTSTETTVIAGDASMATGTAPAGPVSTGALSYSSDALQAAVLNSTNYYRAQHQANALTWDDDLAKYAQDYAKKCEWEHSVSAWSILFHEDVELTTAGWSIRREPGIRVRQPCLRDRRLGRRREKIQLQQGEVLRVDRAFHAAGLEEHYRRRVWRRGVQQQREQRSEWMDVGMRVQSARQCGGRVQRLCRKAR